MPATTAGGPEGGASFGALGLDAMMLMDADTPSDSLGSLLDQLRCFTLLLIHFLGTFPQSKPESQLA